jgi:hypothetical protein
MRRLVDSHTKCMHSNHGSCGCWVQPNWTACQICPGINRVINWPASQTSSLVFAQERPALEDVRVDVKLSCSCRAQVHVDLATRVPDWLHLYSEAWTSQSFFNIAIQLQQPTSIQGRCISAAIFNERLFARDNLPEIICPWPIKPEVK